MEILRYVFAGFAILGAIDKILGNRFKLGKEFEKGIMSAGTLVLAMAGMLCFAPVLANGLSVALSSFSKTFGIDPSFIGAFIANDMGGASVSAELASSPVIGGYNGLVVSSMMGVTICFTIPVSLKMIKKQHHSDVLLGVLCGIATLPIGCIISGLILKIPFTKLILNLSPVLVVAVVTCIGLIIAPKLCCKIFAAIGWIMTFIITVGLAIAIFTHITSKTVLTDMIPLSDALSIICDIAIILSGVFPLIFVISKIFKKPFSYIGKKIGIDEISVVGIVSSLANSIPTFDLIDKMNRKGRIMNMAFAVSASFVFGDHLAFTMSFDQSYLAAMIVGKLISGIFAVIISHFIYKMTLKRGN